MRILFVDKNDKERQLFSIYLENIFKATEVVQLFSSQNAINHIAKDFNFDFILFNNNADNEYDAGDFYRLIRTKHPQIPFILFGDKNPDELNGLEGMKSHHPKNGHIKTPISPADFRKEILNILSPSRYGNGLGVVSAFHRIRLIHFYRFNKVLCDVYLKENSTQYHKILKKDDLYGRDLIDSFRSKKIDFLFIRNEDFEKFQVAFTTMPFLIMDKEGLQERNIDEIITSTHIVLKDLVLHMGFSQEAIELAERSVEEISKMAANAGQKIIDEMMHKQRRKQDYIYDHSYLTAIACCEILEDVHWANEKNIQSLCMASLFHDLTLDNPDIAIVHDQYDSKLEKFSEKEVKKYLKHPMDSVNLLDRVDFVPMEAKNIILQHHETPEGNGFPHRMHPNRLSTLVCTFILAHDYIRYMYENDFDPLKEPEILEKFKKRYNVGNFVQIMEAFEKGYERRKKNLSGNSEEKKSSAA